MTMTTSLSVIARRAALTASKRVPPCTTFIKCLSSNSGKLPDEEYYQGHLMADHLEYLDDMIDKTLKMEESMEGLKDTYQKKRVEFSNIGWTDSAEIDRLFDQASLQKDELSGQIEELRSMMAAAREKGYAVDAPDGTSDVMRRENLKQVNQIIDYAAKHEDTDKVRSEHKQSIRGVDAPDGTSDAMRKENLKQVDEIIDYAAKHEDKEHVEYEHKMENAVRKEQARDPERDW